MAHGMCGCKMCLKGREEEKIIVSVLSPVQTVMIVDDRFNYQAYLNTDYHELSSTIINYHVVWTCSNST